MYHENKKVVLMHNKKNTGLVQREQFKNHKLEKNVRDNSLRSWKIARVILAMFCE